MLRRGTSARLDAECAAGFPIGQRSAMRSALSEESLGDFIDNGTLARHEGGHSRTTGRARWRLEAGDATEIDLNLHGSRFTGDPIRYKQIGLGTPDNPAASNCPQLVGDFEPGNGCVDQTGFADTRAFDENFSGHPDQFSATTGGASLRVQHDFSGLRLTALTAYEGGDSRRAEDTDGGPSFLFASYQQTDSDQWSQDFELGWLGDHWAATHLGLYVFGEDAHYTSLRRFPNPRLMPLLVPGVPIPEDGVLTSMMYGDLEQHARHASAWGSVNLPVSKASSLTAEIRIAYEQLEGEMRSG